MFCPEHFFLIQLCAMQPNVQPKPQKEGSESEQFWDLLGGKSEYPSQKVARDVESDPHLFSCSFTNGWRTFSIVYEHVCLSFNCWT